MDNVKRIKALQDAMTHLESCEVEFRKAQKALEAVGLDLISVDFIEGHDCLLNCKRDELVKFCDALQLKTEFEPFEYADLNYSGRRSLKIWGWKINDLERRK